MSKKRGLAAPARTEPRTFDEVFAEHRLTYAELEALVWHLAAFRARKTVEALLPAQLSALRTPARLPGGQQP